MVIRPLSVTARLVSDVIASERGRSIRVLVYHSISDDDTDPFAVSPDLFRRHMEAIAASGVAVLTCRALLAALSGEQAITKGICITVDDGLEDFATAALPILRASGLPATLFVSTGLAGTSATWPLWSRPRRFLDWSALGALAADGVEVGSHAYEHVRLERLAEADLLTDLRRSRSDLSDRLPWHLDAIAYPFGGQSPSVRMAAGIAGYHAGFGVGGLWGNRRGSDPFALRRVLITRETTAERLSDIARGIDDRRTAIRAITHRKRLPI
jgi:peptidoglycan/xylan/chitin deacetylase (PgdA/CDA1 family)